ncbi:hypothetical protein BVC80_1587g33 [Macleaya cordata]|uniref:Uncharacterized protein n=1 Tax=Macleaya cordata TaxID=56857 RepID=A0A200QLL6_MACCD|nr:hypothetical protein BVC80_1587g33 [Macleaya cordata]
MEDPFASISYQCKISSSQENLLQHYFFAHEPQGGQTPFSIEEFSSSSSSDPDEFPVENTGIMICSPPDGSSNSGEEEEVAHPTVEEEFQTPDERFLICSSEKEPRKMEIDEYLASKVNDDDDFHDDQWIDAVDDASHDAGTIDLGKDSNSVVFSEENLLAENGSPMLGTVLVDDVEKSRENENQISRCESGENEVLIRKSPIQEDLGLLESKNEGLGESPCNNPIEFEKDLNLNVLVNVEFTSGEDCVGDVAEKTLESTVAKNQGFLKCSSDSPCDSEKAPESSMRKSLIQEDLGLLESKNDGFGESPCNHPIELKNNLNLNAVDNVELTSGDDCVGDVAEKTLESTVEKILGVLKCSSHSPCDSEKAPESSVAAANENVVDINASNELDLKSHSDNSKEDCPVLHHPRPVIPEASKEVVMEDSSPVAIEKDIRHNVSTDMVPGFDNMQTNELHSDDGKLCNNSKEELNLGVLKCSSHSHCDSEKAPESSVAVANENVVDINDSNKLDLKSHSDNSKEDCPVLHHPRPVIPESSKEVVMEKSEHADSCDLSPEVTSENNTPGLRRLPNWVGGSDNAMEDSTQSRYRRAGKEKNSDPGQKKRVEETEDLGRGGKRFGEAEGSSRVAQKDLGHGGIRLEEEGSDNGGKRFGEVEGSSRVAEEYLGHGRIRLVQEGSDHGAKRFGEEEGSSRVAEALLPGNESQTTKKFLDASFFRATHRSRGNDDNSKENNPQTKDILEVAVRAGLKVPRPRWWRPGGYKTR